MHFKFYTYVGKGQKERKKNLVIGMTWYVYNVSGEFG